MKISKWDFITFGFSFVLLTVAYHVTQSFWVSAALVAIAMGWHLAGWYEGRHGLNP